MHYPLTELKQETNMVTMSEGQTKEIQEVTINTKVQSNTQLTVKRLSSPAKSCSSVASVCRICHEAETPETLISPCECSGTMALVHVSCLERWLSTSNTDYCELCKFNFRTHRGPRPITQWLCSRNMPAGPNGFYGDVLCLLILTPLCFVSVYLCSVGAYVYIQKGQWEGVGLAFISICVLLTYFLWSYITVRAWRGSNQIIQLVNNRVAPTVRVPVSHHLEVL
ncbi:E3 ubiquitin-protein ligase MARCH3-like isoform X2 [Cimex lectularius]|uniref:Uncharacterized protein n=1 Tax=Cimex lectularius TaxID=79782 RepID=A0A8I6RXG8_CIMLE|nr:E3 ubiquitin-protein ligase MARCH3-like isoform X2 [Cimex lectularius]